MYPGAPATGTGIATIGGGMGLGSPTIVMLGVALMIIGSAFMGFARLRKNARSLD